MEWVFLCVFLFHPVTCFCNLLFASHFRQSLVQTPNTVLRHHWSRMQCVEFISWCVKEKTNRVSFAHIIQGRQSPPLKNWRAVLSSGSSSAIILCVFTRSWTMEVKKKVNSPTPPPLPIFTWYSINICLDVNIKQQMLRLWVAWEFAPLVRCWIFSPRPSSKMADLPVRKQTKKQQQ